MAQFKGMNDARVVQKAPFTIPGTYPEVEIMGMRLLDPNHKKETCFIIEMLVVRSLVEDRANGTPMSVVRTDKFGMPHLYGQVKAFLAQIEDCSPDLITDEVANKAIGPENPYKGQRRRVYAWNRPTSNMDKNGEPGEFTEIQFGPCLPAEAELGKALPGPTVLQPQIEGGGPNGGAGSTH